MHKSTNNDIIQAFCTLEDEIASNYKMCNFAIEMSIQEHLFYVQEIYAFRL